ncbi:putative Golgi apparatus and endoplasmic reticulum protein Svp26 [Ascodesmis nigricans]|uniref:Putative Golgi apparatus and endoplasmic reticulum protein Svp26 n=1 Tax=Ascodesmis nigricans TaxID=341454 RepID=A0A4V3SHM0_9PEZI|nr:putative Golgi apparatus and endoplasmic reticulum protein Svp26 [Ascodesmis nigricans]
MWIFPLLGYVGVILGFAFLTLAIASGLYYLSELVEEHTVLSKKILTRLIQTIITAHVLLLLLDGFPVMLTLFSAASHGVYLSNVRHSFPYVKLGDPVFLLSCFLVVANHFLWFRHFSNPPAISLNWSFGSGRTNEDSLRYNYHYSLPEHRYPTFTEISAFFGICVWLVPFALFVSLSASDNVLPTMGAESIGASAGSSGGFEPLGAVNAIGGEGRKRGEGLAKAVFGSVKEWVVESAEALGFNQVQRRREHVF